MPEKGQNPIINYFQESFGELKKVTWPTRNKAIRLTLIVTVFCLVVAVIIGLFDFAFNQGYKSLVLYADKAFPAKPSAPLKVDNVNAVVDTQEKAKNSGN